MAQMDKPLRKLVYWSGYKRQKWSKSFATPLRWRSVSEIFDTLEGTGEDFAIAKQKLKDYFAPKKNTGYEVYKFRQANSQQMRQ
jgi:hypothetical protein